MAIAARTVLATPEAAVPQAAGRRADLDLLRAFVVVGLIVFHSAMVFGPLDWFVENSSTNIGFAIFVLWGSGWGMPLLFLVSGMGVWYSLRGRSGIRFVKERTVRLVVPYLFGLVLLVPPMFYIGRLDDLGFRESYGSFWLDFLDLRPALRHLPSPVEWTSHGHLLDQGHLWFLYYLFIFSLLLLPIFLWLRTGRGARILARSSIFLERRGAIFLLALPIAGLEAILRTNDNTGGWNPAVYSIFLLYGFLIAADRRFEASMRRHRRAALVIGVAGAMGLIFWTGMLEEAGREPLEEGGVAMAWRALQASTGWLWVVAIMGYASALMARREGRSTPSTGTGTTRTHRIARYANEAVLPFYVLHETVIVAIAYGLVRWNVDLVSKYLALVIASFVTTLALYEFAVRRTRITRFLFGMKQPRDLEWSPARDSPSPDRAGERAA